MKKLFLALALICALPLHGAFLSGPDLQVTGAATQTASGNNIILASAGTAATDAAGFRGITIEIVPTGTVTSGAVAFEGSNDNTNFTSVYLYDLTAITTGPVASYSPVTSTPRFFGAQLPYRYIRARISTVIGGGGSLQAYTRLQPILGQTPISQPVSGTVTANIGTSGSLALDATLTGGTSRTKITDGTTNAAVKAASTAAVAADPAIVVAISPNNTIPVSLSGNQATNVAQVAGTTTDTNSGAKSAGTLRVVLATDQPQLTNALKTDGSATTQPVSGTVTANAGTNLNTSALALDATLTGGTQRNKITDGTTNVAVKAASTAAVAADPALVVAISPNNSVAVTGTVTANAGTNLNTSALALDATLTGGNARTKITDGTTNAAVKAASTAAVAADPAVVVAISPNNTIPVSISGNQATNVAQVAGTTTDTNSGSKSAGTLRVVLATDQPQLTNALKTDGSATTQPVSGMVTANIGTSGSLALDASVAGLSLAQASTTSGQKGALVQGAVTTAAPTYTAAQTSPLSLNTAGGLRVDPSGVTQPVSAASLPLPAGASTSAKQPALGTAGASSADVITIQGVASMTAVKTDGSATTQPVSGTVTANAGTNLNTSALSTSANQTNGTQQSKVTDGTTVAAVKAASTAAGATDPALVVAISPNNTVPVSLSGNQAVNVAQVASTTAATGNGVVGAGVQRVAIASDNTAFNVIAAPTSTAPTTAATVTEGTKAPAAIATPETLVGSSTLVYSVIIRAGRTARVANTSSIWIGRTSTNDTQQIELIPGGTLTLTAPPGKYIDLQTIWVDAVTLTDGVTYFAEQ